MHFIESIHLVSMKIFQSSCVCLLKIKNKKENQANEAMAAKDAANEQKAEERKNNSLKPPTKKTSLCMTQKGAVGTEISSFEVAKVSKKAMDIPRNKNGAIGGKMLHEEVVAEEDAIPWSQDREGGVSVGGGGEKSNGAGAGLAAKRENYTNNSLQNEKCHNIEGINNAESNL